MSEEVKPTMSLELGQMVFGNPTGAYGMPLYADALLESLLSEIERVFWNTKQKEWDRFDDPEIPGVTFHPYYWGDDLEKSSLPNFLSDLFPAQEIRWYKHPGRGTSCTVEYTPAQWVEWYTAVHSQINKADVDICKK